MNFEMHITVAVADAERAQPLADHMGWKTSQIARDPLLGDYTYFYITGHDTEYQRLYSTMKYAVKWLNDHDVFVIREKIELIMHDIRHEKEKELKT